MAREWKEKMKLLSFKKFIKEDDNKPFPHILEVNPGGHTVKKFLHKTKHGMARYVVKNNEKGERELHVGDSSMHVHDDIAKHAGIRPLYDKKTWKPTYAAGYLHHDRDNDVYTVYHHPGYASHRTTGDLFDKFKENGFNVKSYYGNNKKSAEVDI
jgi:hypothetical protein